METAELSGLCEEAPRKLGAESVSPQAGEEIQSLCLPRYQNVGNTLMSLGENSAQGANFIKIVPCEAGGQFKTLVHAGLELSPGAGFIVPSNRGGQGCIA